jgi:hypothetical protein
MSCAVFQRVDGRHMTAQLQRVLGLHMNVCTVLDGHTMVQYSNHITKTHTFVTNIYKVRLSRRKVEGK